MTRSILNKVLLFILSGLAYAFASHYMMKGFNQPFSTDEMLHDFLFFGTLMVVLKIVEEQFSKRRKKKQSEDQPSVIRTISHSFQQYMLKNTPICESQV